MSEISASSCIVLLAAGAMAGGVNAVAGGGTLISVPALLALGVSPVAAAASNAVAVWPGHALATVSYRHTLRQTSLGDARLLQVCIVGGVGGALGAAGLRAAGDAAFSGGVPVLIGLATVVFALGPRLTKNGTLRVRPGTPTWLFAALLISVYGGFFGAGLGVMLMAVLLLLGVDAPQKNNALKNLIATCITTSSVIMMIASGLVSWAPTIIVTLGALLGGFLGARAAQHLNADLLRRTVICLGCALTVFYAGKYWA